MITDLRDRCTGDSFGFYYKVLMLQGSERHDLRLFSKRYEIQQGILCLFDKDGNMYRSFAPGTWQEIAAVSVIDGSEMYEDHDYVDEAEPVKAGKSR